MEFGGKRVRKQRNMLAGLCVGSSCYSGLSPALVPPVSSASLPAGLSPPLRPAPTLWDTLLFPSLGASWSSLISLLHFFPLGVEPGLGADHRPACRRCLAAGWVQLLVPAWSHVSPLQTGQREEAGGRLPRPLLQLAVLPALKRTVTFYGPFSFPMVILILHSMYVPFLGY